MTDLFDIDRALTPDERKRLRVPCGQKKRGHVWHPGTGPAGETCGSCRHLVRMRMSKTFFKCGLAQATWTHGVRTDIRKRDAACKKWEAADG